jgi:hypothetical protein
MVHRRMEQKVNCERSGQKIRIFTEDREVDTIKNTVVTSKPSGTALMLRADALEIALPEILRAIRDAKAERGESVGGKPEHDPDKRAVNHGVEEKKVIVEPEAPKPVEAIKKIKKPKQAK